MDFGYYTYKCTLVRVIDGDTIVGMVDLGFDTWKKVTIRIADIDAPEIRTKDLQEKEMGYKAKDRVEELLSTVNFTLVSNSVDGFGRSVGTVYNEEGIQIGDTLINEDLAVESIR